MKNKIEKIILELSVNLTIEVEGIYTPEEPMVRYYPDGSGFPGSPEEYEPNYIKLLKGNLMDYTDYIENFYYQQFIKSKEHKVTFHTIWEHISEKCLEQLNKREYEK